MAGSFDLKKTASGQFMFNLKAGNGQVILTSEQYKAKASAENGIKSVRMNSADDNRFDVRESSSGKPYFVLTATNGQVIGQSEMYSSASACSNGVASVKKNAPDAKVNDLT